MEHSMEKGNMMQKYQTLFCEDKHHKMEKFLEVCLLLLLYDEIGYGYGLIEQLVYFGFSKDELNVSTLYKTLRKMEKDKLVSSFWQKSGRGPRRRVYKITDGGKKILAQWILTLERKKERIDTIIKSYNGKIQTREEKEV
jgi:PadR family transcriptional regulator, regulatory protein PadR